MMLDGLLELASVYQFFHPITSASRPPQFSYHLTEMGAHKILASDSCKVVEVAERKGINFTSIRGAVVLPDHTLNEPSGTLSMWVMALDDLAS